MPLRSLIRALSGKVHYKDETVRYILVSSLDLFMTYLLLVFSARRWTRIRVVESNPIADFFFGGWGIRGMIYFKFCIVAIVVVLAQIIASKRPRTAKLLLDGATLLVAGVVVYSLVMFIRVTY